MSKVYLPITTVLIFLNLANLGSSNIFCSVVCKPNDCDNQTSTGCKSCDTDFMMTGSTCTVNPSSGWTLVSESVDLGSGLTVNISGSPTGICGSQTFFGNIASIQAVMISSINGIVNPFYSLEIIYGIILIDDWDGDTIISTTLIQQTPQMNSTLSSVRQTSKPLCGSGTNQQYLKVIQSWSFNQTNVQLDFQVKMLRNQRTSPWGVKQFQLLAKYCNINCSSCWSSLISNCWSCISGMLLNNNTCNQSCLTGFGSTTDGMTCVWCNLRCTSCFQTMNNCSTCTTSGQWKSFLVADNFSCVATCPDKYYENISTLICDPCDPICQTCEINSSHCYECISSYGWYSYYCYNPCPIGTYADLTHPVYIGSINCTNCSKYCIQCIGSPTVCTSCTLNGSNQAYLLNSTCYQICPLSYYKENYNNIGPNECLSCDISCAVCTNNPSPCQKCNPFFYLYQSICGTSCPNSNYFPDKTTWTCLDCSIYCVDLTINIYFSDNMNSEIYIDMNFTQPLNFSSFPIEAFQVITQDSSFITLNMFNIQYIQTSQSSYRIILAPKGYIFIYNVTFTVTTMIKPSPIDYSINDAPFKSSNYQKSANLKWFLIKSPSMNSLEQSFINGLSNINDKVSMITTLPFVQEIKKAGVFSLLMGGAQITSCSILVNTIPAQNMYEGVRFWAMFVFFEVPKWQQNSDKTKYVVASQQNKIIQNARLLTVKKSQRILFDTSSIDWRFQRTGHTSFFIFDCYMNILMIAFCWTLIIIGHCIMKKKKSLKNYMGKFYCLLHKVHEITILYISLATLLQWIYFDSASIQRWISFISCIFANLYFLIYQLYIYHDILNYPKARIGTQLYQYYLMKYGSFLKNIRYEEFEIEQDWSPKQWLRPYNYHFFSYYKKLMMMVSLPLFYDADNSQIYVLIFIQILEILRFFFTWPFKSKSRNIMRLLLQFMLLFFFFTVAASQYIIKQIMKLDSLTQATQLQIYIKNFYGVGWTSFILIFLFNFGFLSIFIYDIWLGCKKSNRQLMDQARRNYYMQKLKSYEQNNENVPLGMVNKWVKLGNLNKRNFRELPKINIRIECFRITKSQNGGFWIEMKKLLDLYINVQFNFQKLNNITASKTINKNFWLKRTISSYFFHKIQQLYQFYYQKQQFQSLTLKTFIEVEQSEYKPGDKINIELQKISQKIELHFYKNKAQVIQLKELIQGFPIQQNLLQYL